MICIEKQTRLQERKTERKKVKLKLNNFVVVVSAGVSL